MNLKKIEPKSKNKKGALSDTIIWMIIGFVFVIFFSGWLFIQNQVTTTFMDVGNIGSTNVTNITQDIMQPTNSSLPHHLNIWGLILIFGSILSIFIHNFLIKSHPAYFILYFFIAVVAIILSAYISNIYMDLLNSSGTLLSEGMNNFESINYIMQWLPYWVAVVTLIGAVFLFIQLRKNEEGGFI